ncbi:MAG TPA: hypothetical protein PKY96_12470 [Flavobacteriales bacterium]|nr:hypothetical protein [Flavobacteriales bacterium]
MKNATTLLIGFAICQAACAALPPFASAPLNDHLREVNAQWVKQDPTPYGGAAPAAFAQESDRIRTHLLMVRERLLARNTNGLAADQRSNRLHLLNRLGAYADGRRFPQNLVLAERNPVFIDPFGTACAVGWLMIESGYGEVAKAISAGFNLGYVHEIIADDRFAAPVVAWADAHGFTADELAWIQPGYPPALPWQPFGGGANGEVTVLESLGNGNLLMAGVFTEAGGTAANRVAVWNGSTFVPLGNGLQGTVNCAAEFEGDIYIGGAMLNGTADLARWNGAAWSFQTVFEGKYPVVTALHVHDGALHAAGTISGFAGNTDHVARLEIGQWQPVGSALNGTVHALDTHAGRLVAAGAFTGFAYDPVPELAHVAELEGNEWSQLANGLNATVRDLLSVNGALHAAGDMYMNIAPVFGMARMAAGAPEWEPLMPNLADYIFPTIGTPRIERIVHHEGSIFFVGEFGISTSMMLFGYNVGRWDAPDVVAELATPEATVHAAVIHGGHLVIGGAFANWQPHVAVLDISTSLTEAPIGQKVTAAPNPAHDLVRFTGLKGIDLSSMRITDGAGRVHRAQATRQDDAILLDAGALAPGAYVMELMTSIGPASIRFMKQ